MTSPAKQDTLHIGLAFKDMAGEARSRIQSYINAQLAGKGGAGDNGGTEAAGS